MKFVIALMVVLTASIASAQQNAQPQVDMPWHLSLGAAPAAWMHTPDLDPQGQIVRKGVSMPIAPDMIKKPFWDVRADYTPADSLGFGLKFLNWSRSGSVSGSEPATSEVMMWEANENAHIATGDPLVRGDIGYSTGAKQSLQRVDGTVIYGRSFSAGYASAFAGLSHLTLEQRHNESQDRRYLILNIPPGQTTSTTPVILEDYEYQANSAMKFTGLGPMFGGEVSVCPVGHILLQGRGDIAWYLWGKGNTATGAWDWSKTGSLVPTSGGVNQAPGGNLFPPITVRTAVPKLMAGQITGVELEGSVRYQVSRNLQIGVGPAWAKYSGLPAPTRYTIPTGFAPEKGHWETASGSEFPYWTWVVTASLRF